MKRLSLWAYRNPWQARISLTIIHLLLILIAFYWGSNLYIARFIVPTWCLTGLIALFFAAVVFYPIRGYKKGIWKQSYTKQKIFDLVLVVVGMLMTCTMSNWFCNTLAHESQQSYSFELASYTVQRHIQEDSYTQDSFKAKKKKIRRAIKEWLKKNRKEKPSFGKIVGKFMLTLATLSLAFVLTYLVGQFACQLSCSGAEGMATTVLITGVLGISILAILALRAIFKPKSVATKSITGSYRSSKFKAKKKLYETS